MSWLQRIKLRRPRLVVEIALAIVLILALEAFLTRDAVRGPAPPIDAYTLTGEPFSLSQFEGAPAVIHFWATWCRICELEQGMINRLAERHQVMTVAMQSGSPQAVAVHLSEHGVDYPVINDPDGILAARYGVHAVPASFVLNKRGEVLFVTRGYTSGFGLRVRLWLAGG